MLIQNDERSVEKVGVQKEGTFSVKATAKTFQILSSGLYSDIQKAIIRELSTNAYDSQVQAGNKDRPFDVHLPTVLEPYLEIRDYGTGLSEEDMFNTYCTYFESTKTNSNDYVGCLGLGSKTPFSYSDNFIVKSYINGNEYIYSAFVGEGGFPKISLLSAQPTKEHNGLKINISIKKEDIQQFIQKASEVYLYFAVKPRMTGHTLDIKEAGEEKFNLSSGRILKKPNDYHSQFYSDTILCKMGNIGYAINNNDSYKHQIENTFTGTGHFAELNFDIGDLDISANRETLQYTEKTKLAIDNKIQKIREELEERVKSELLSAKSDWEKFLITVSYRQILKQNVAPFTISKTKKDEVNKDLPASFESTSFNHYGRSKYKESRTSYLEEGDCLMVNPPSKRYVKAYLKLFLSQTNNKHIRIINIDSDIEKELKDHGVPDSMFLEKKKIEKIALAPRVVNSKPKNTRKAMNVKREDVDLCVNTSCFCYLGTAGEISDMNSIVLQLLQKNVITKSESENIYFIDKRRADIVNSTKWQHLSTFWKEVKSRAKKEDIAAAGIVSELYSGTALHEVIRNSKIKEFQEFAKQIEHGIDFTSSGIMRIYNKIPGELPGFFEAQDVAKKTITKVHKQYPLLTWTPINSMNADRRVVDAAIEYVKLIDNTTK